MQEKEVWKDIDGYDGYQISNLGRVKSLSKKVVCQNGFRTTKERIMKKHNQPNKYETIQMGKKKPSESVHRLVAKSFIPNPENKPQVNHINGIKNDNRLNNLEWCTQSENMIHAYKNGLQIALKGKGIRRNTCKNVIRIDSYGNTYKYESVYDASKDGFNENSIRRVCNGGRKRHKGYYWKYE